MWLQGKTCRSYFLSDIMKNKLSGAAGEFIGSFADLGTLLPLVIGLIAFNGISAGPAIVLLGITYIFTGAYYRLPVPVQPLKAVAIIAIATGASIGEIRAAAYWMAGIMLVLGITRLANKLNDVFPRVLIRGLQLNLGIMMIRTGIKFILSYPDSLASVILKTHKVIESVSAAGVFPPIADFRTAFILLVIPQIPLTIGNAVLATRDCAVKYFGDKSERVTPAKLATTIGFGNLAAALAGGVPVCHGAGGMTAHYGLGARTGAACMIIGSLLLAVGVLKGNSAAVMLSMMPASVLGILLAYVGVRHAMLASDAFRSPATAAIVLCMGVTGWFTNNLLITLGVGLAAKLLLDGVFLMRRRNLMTADE